jgi:O-antigen/teichoic acid export membrane protein
MMPFVIRSLGDSIYGLWIFIGSFFDFYGLFDLGFASSVQRYVSRAIGIKDYKDANVVVNTSLFLFSIIGIIAFIFTIIASLLVPLFIKNIAEITLFRQIILILGISFAISLPMKVFYGVLTSHLRYDILTIINIAHLIIRSIFIFIFLKFGYGILALAFITLGTDIALYASCYFASKMIGNYIIFSRQLIKLQRIKSLFQYGIFTFINQIADKLRFGIDNFVITIFLGLSQVTVYSIASRLILYFINFVITATGIMVPVFSQYEGRGDYASIREKFLLTTKISTYLAIFIGGTFLLFGKQFIIRWVGLEYKNSYSILVVLVIPTIFALMQSPSVQLVYGLSKHRFFSISNSIEGVCNLLLSIVLVKYFGLMGVALGTAIPMFFIKLLVQPVYTCRIIEIDLKEYYFKLLLPGIIKSTTAFVIFWYIFKSYLVPKYSNLLVLLVLNIIFFSVFIFILGFKRSEIIYFKNAIIGEKAFCQDA